MINLRKVANSKAGADSHGYTQSSVPNFAYTTVFAQIGAPLGFGEDVYDFDEYYFTDSQTLETHELQDVDVPKSGSQAAEQSQVAPDVLSVSSEKLTKLA